MVIVGTQSLISETNKRIKEEINILIEICDVNNLFVVNHLDWTPFFKIDFIRPATN